MMIATNMVCFKSDDCLNSLNRPRAKSIKPIIPVVVRTVRRLLSNPDLETAPVWRTSARLL